VEVVEEEEVAVAVAVVGEMVKALDGAMEVAAAAAGEEVEAEVVEAAAGVVVVEVEEEEVKGEVGVGEEEVVEGATKEIVCHGDVVATQENQLGQDQLVLPETKRKGDHAQYCMGKRRC
jgi:hypothetical protein